MSDDFSWDNDESIVVEPVLGIAVYENPDGDVVIRIQSDCSDGDEFIAIPRDRARAVAAAINRLLRKRG
jgi:hypothetical protein